MRPAEPSAVPPRKGVLTVLGLVLFGAIFLALLAWLTSGNMHPPPPETRTERR